MDNIIQQPKPVLFGVERFGPHGAGVITINRPPQLNALNTECYRLIEPKLRQWVKDPEVAFLLLEGAGEKAFCAGGDVKTLALEIKKHGIAYAKEFFECEYGVDGLIHHFPKPVVAFLNGITMGGGIGFSRGAKFKIATEKTVMAMPETAIGLFPDVGATRFLHDLPMSFGLFMGLTGFRLQGPEAVDFALCDFYCPSSLWRKVRADLLRLNLTEDAKINHQLIAQYLSAILKRPDKSQLFHEWESVQEKLKFKDYFQWRDAFLGLKNLSPRWKEAQDKFFNGSPTSRRVFFVAFQKHRSLSILDTLAAEWDMAVAFCKQHDFSEGVRAVLIDKDQNPVWQPSDDKSVSDSFIEAHFSSGETNPLRLHGIRA